MIWGEAAISTCREVILRLELYISLALVIQFCDTRQDPCLRLSVLRENEGTIMTALPIFRKLVLRSII